MVLKIMNGLNHKILVMTCAASLVFSCTKLEIEDLFFDSRLVLTSDLALDRLQEAVKRLPNGENKFALTEDGLIVSSSGEKKPNHADLAGEKTALTGGYIRFDFSNGVITSLVIDNYSGHLCPSFESLTQVISFFATSGLDKSKIILQNRPNLKKCL